MAAQSSLVHILDLNFLNLSGTIAAYLIPHAGGAALIECGPGSTFATLTRRLADFSLQPADITDVFVTHIHLDHAGAAGLLAKQGARIHVHPAGAPHLINPEKLLSSAQRIYGEAMDTLWGQFLPVPEDQIHRLEDREIVELDGIRIQALETPGHAVHHHAYLLNDELCFTGDIGGVRLAGAPFVRLPLPPPDIQLQDWRRSLDRLSGLLHLKTLTALVPTHFGPHRDVGQYLTALYQALDEIEQWIEAVMPADPSLEELNARFQAWEAQKAQAEGMDDRLHTAYEAANPSWMSAAGIQRYWRKHRQPAQEN